MRLQDLICRARVHHEELSGDAEIDWITADSRRMQSRSLFVCMPSGNSDSHEFIREAIENGAAAVVVHSIEGAKIAKNLKAPFVRFGTQGCSFNVAAGRISRTLFNDPSMAMRVIAITGTNGKTTTAWMLRDALTALGRRAAYLGTLGYQAGDSTEAVENTTPFPVELWQLLTQARESGIQDFVMETSSHALFERRLAGVQFDLGAFTNLTQDHLDYHGTMECYAQAKKLLFTEYAMASEKPFIAVINGEDQTAASWLLELPVSVLTFGGRQSHFDLQAARVAVDCMHVRLSDGSTAEVEVGGHFNVENCRAAAACLSALGYSTQEIKKGLEAITPVPGRFEAIKNHLDIGIIVDYAHTPDALDKLLASARNLKPKRILTVFGCGGDRDRTKRPKMAKVVSKRSDLAVVTSDNPRTEDPQAIVNDILAGLEHGKSHEVILDREQAIQFAIQAAKPGDLVIIAGKGHEDYQIIGRSKHPMDDRLMARAAAESQPK